MGAITQYLNKHLLLYSFICCIGAVIFGWEVGMLNILYSMKSSFGLKFGLYSFDETTHEYRDTGDKTFKEMIITPSFTLGCMFGTILVYFIMDRLGRAKSLYISSVIYIIGVIIQVTFDKIYTLIIGRIIAGIASGIATTLCPVFIAEISPKEIRGTLGIVNSLGLQLGKTLACFYETLCLKLIIGHPETQWRVAISGLAVPSTIFLIVVWFLPETPRFLLMKNKDSEALDVLSRIREKDKEDPDIIKEYNEMSTKLKNDMAAGVITWKEVFDNRSYVYRFYIIIILQLLYMLVGINAISYYSTQMYSKFLGIPTKTYGAWLATINAAIGLFFSLPAMKYIERIGRRRTLLIGAFTLGTTMILIFFLCFTVAHTSGTISKILGWSCVLVMYVFTIANCWCWSSTIPVWQAEVFPIRLRAKANSVGLFFKYVGSIIVASTTTHLMKLIEYYAFWIYASFCIIAFFFIYFFIRETAGLSLEEMEHIYDDKNFEKNKAENLKKTLSPGNSNNNITEANADNIDITDIKKPL